MSILSYYKLTKFASTPVRSTSQSAGYDISSAYDYIIPPHDKMLIKTDLTVILPEGTYGRIAPRSGLAVHNFIDVGAGVIDRDYTGNLKVLLFNHSGIPFLVHRGDRIAQLICERIVEPVLVELSSPVTNDERGDRGFGSTVMDNIESQQDIAESSTKKQGVKNNIRAPRSAKSPPQPKQKNSYDLRDVVNILIIAGLNTVELWEKVLFNVRQQVSELMNTDLTTLYLNLKMVSNGICTGVATTSDLSAEKFEKLNSLERPYAELMSLADPVLNVFKDNRYTSDTVKLFKDLATKIIQQANSIEISDDDDDDDHDRNKTVEIGKKRKHDVLESDDEDDDDDVLRLFGKKFSSNKKTKNQTFSQQVTLRAEETTKKCVSPGETGKYLIKVEITECDELKGVTPLKHWTKVWKKAVFLVDNEKDPSFTAVSYVWSKQAKKLLKLNDVKVTEFETKDNDKETKRSRFFC